MNKEDLKKEVRCIVIEECYYGGRIVRNGESLTVKRHEFSPTCLVAVDEKGKALAKQPKKLNTKAVKAAFAAGGEGFKEQEKEADFPLIGAADMEKSTNSGATDLSEDEVINEAVELADNAEETVVESKEGEGAAALI